MSETISFANTLKNSNARNFLLGSKISSLGDYFSLVVTSLLAYKLSNSAWISSLIPVSKIIFILIFAPFIGAWADRVNPKRMFIISTLLQSIVTFGMFMFPRIEILLIFSTVASGLNLAASTSSSVLRKNIFSSQQFKQLNGLSTSLQGPIVVGMPPLAALVVQLIGYKYAFLIDSVTFLIALRFYSMIEFTEGNPAKISTENVGQNKLDSQSSSISSPEKISMTQQFRNAFDCLKSHRDLQTLIGLVLLGNLGFCAFHFTFLLGAKLFSGSPLGVGLTQACLGGGALLMPLILARVSLKPEVTSIHMLAMAHIFNGLLTVLIGINISTVVTLGVVLLTSMTDTLIEVYEENACFDCVPKSSFGVIQSFFTVGHRIVSLACIPFFGWIIDQSSVFSAFTLSGIFIIGSGIFGLFRSRGTSPIKV